MLVVLRVAHRVVGKVTEALSILSPSVRSGRRHFRSKQESLPLEPVNLREHLVYLRAILVLVDLQPSPLLLRGLLLLLGHLAAAEGSAGFRLLDVTSLPLPSSSQFKQRVRLRRLLSGAGPHAHGEIQSVLVH